jgi:hypothetical protein
VTAGEDSVDQLEKGIDALIQAAVESLSKLP